MHFVHQPYIPGETIAAIATPPGEGGVAIIRISGKEALDVASKVFSKPIKSFKTHTAHYGIFIDQDGQRVDDGLVLPMLGNRSYTGEDTVEFFCHGGSLISRRVLEVVLAAGARAARPGEFTFKAFMNGKIDLAQAEAVQEVIAAKNERALDAAELQLQGKLSQQVLGFQKELIDMAAILEAWVDFPEEGLEFATMDEILTQISTVEEKLELLIETYHDGKIVHEGLALCLAGRPNVGKSSLMNALLDKERAIVSPIAGTTRDLVEDQLRLSGLNFRLVDTAGIRQTDEIIEKEGIRRSKEALKQADLVLLVLEATEGLTEEDRELIEIVPKQKTIAIWNKSDLPHGELPSLPIPALSLSALKKSGLQDLKKAIDKVIWSHGPPSKEEVVVTNIRHKEALQEALEALKKVKESLSADISPEFITFDMREALQALGKIIGTDISEDIITSIFSKFCIGK